MRRLAVSPICARISRAAVAATVLAVLLAGPTLSAPEDHRAQSPDGTAAVYAADRITPVPGAWSLLDRTPSGLTMVIHAVGLTPGHAYAVWWVIFNDPAFCTHANTGTGARCGNDDLPANEGNPRVQATMTYATGHVVDAAAGVRTTDFAAWLPAEAWSSAAFGPGLLDPVGAEVHLLVADLGPVNAVLDANQLRARARADGCAGTPSVACAPAQISFQIP